MVAPTKAYLKLTQPRIGGSELGRVTFSFNPKEYTIAKGATWNREPQRGAQSSVPPDFGGATPSTTTVEIFLDGFESGADITSQINLLFSCVCPVTATLDNKVPSAPWVVFGWGQFSFTAVVKQVSVRYQMFDPSGVPLRATASVTLEEVPTDTPARQNPTSGTDRVHRSHLVIEGDSLASIAYQHYQDASLWRAIAESNSIDDPMRLMPGRQLLIPAAAQAVALR
jgi:nucleoid-associated protein YgaU